MISASVQVERRVGQRFSFLLPVSFRSPATGVEGVAFTQNLSSRGAFFLTDAPLREGDEIELTLTMPSEITLGENMRVRCRGRIVRIFKPADKAPEVAHELVAETKIAVAVRLDGYEYLPDSPEVSASPRVAVLHPHSEEDRAI